MALLETQEFRPLRLLLHKAQERVVQEQLAETLSDQAAEQTVHLTLLE